MGNEYKISIKFQPDIFTLLTYELLSLADKGHSLPVKLVMNMCEDYTIMNWLKENTQAYSLWDDDVKVILAEEFFSLANCIIPEDTYNISSNGILLLAAFCQELINQHGPSRTRVDCDCAELELRKLGII